MSHVVIQTGKATWLVARHLIGKSSSYRQLCSCRSEVAAHEIRKSLDATSEKE